MTSPHLRTLALCMAFALSGVGVAHAEPPAKAAARAEPDPRADVLARQHSTYVTRWFTADLFASVEGKHADLCRVDHIRSDTRELVSSRWVRFGERRWELAYQLIGPMGAPYWIHNVVDLDASGRVVGRQLTSRFVSQPWRVGAYERSDWAPEGALAKVHAASHPITYTVDPKRPELVHALVDNGIGSRHVMRITPLRIEMRDGLKKPVRYTFAWGKDGSLSIKALTGQSTLRFDFGAHGALIRRTEVPDYDNGRYTPLDVTSHFGDDGRLSHAVFVGHGGGFDVTPVYGCAWPAELDEPEPPDEAAGGGGR